MIAAVKGHRQAAHMLLARGGDPNLRDIYGWTALMRAASRNRPQTVRLLLEDPRTDIATRDDDGATALHHAAEEGHEALVELLIAAGADPKARDAAGRTAAERAALNGYPSLAKLLTAATPPG